MNNMIPPDNKLRNIIESHKQIDSETCVFMTMELVLQLLGIKPIGYRDLQESHKGIQGFWKDYEGKSFGGNGEFKFLELFRVRTKECNMTCLHETIKSIIDRCQFVVVSLKNPDKYHNFVIYKYENDMYYGITYDDTKSEPQFRTNLKSEINKEDGTPLQYYDLPDPIDKQDKNRIVMVLETKRLNP